MQRRFVVYRDSPAAGARGPLPKCNDALQSLGDRFFAALASEDSRYEQLAPGNAQKEEAYDERDVVATISDLEWAKGVLDKRVLHADETVAAVISGATTNGSDRRLYLTDGVLPTYKEKQIPSDTPGVHDRVNDVINDAVPSVVRTDRKDTVFTFDNIESDGVASWNYFAPLGGGCPITAFHQETKKRRAWNLGCGDFIVQPLATSWYAERIERVHEVVTGSHARHYRILPLEMYLEEGIPLVVYLRDSATAEYVELPELSNHCFATFRTDRETSLLHKAACNDWDLRSEMLTAYLLEKLHSPDECDGWCESAMFTTSPASSTERQQWSAEKRPWASAIGYDVDGQGGIVKEQRDTSMRVIVVRTAEKLVDTLEALESGKLEHDPEQLSIACMKEALRNLLPAVKDLASSAPTDPRDGDERLHAGDFSREYLDEVVSDIERLTSETDASREVQLLSQYLSADPRARDTVLKFAISGSIDNSNPVKVKGYWILALHCEAELSSLQANGAGPMEEESEGSEEEGHDEDESEEEEDEERRKQKKGGCGVPVTAVKAWRAILEQSLDGGAHSIWTKNAPAWDAPNVAELRRLGPFKPIAAPYDLLPRREQS